MTCPQAKWRDLFLVGAQEEASGKFTGLRYMLPGYLRSVHAIKVLGYSMTRALDSTQLDYSDDTHYVLRCREIHSDVLSNRESMSALCVLPTTRPQGYLSSTGATPSNFNQTLNALQYFDSAGIASIDIRPPQKFPTLTFELLKWDLSSSDYTPVKLGTNGELALHLQILVDET
jgi:hypothetical protein